VIDLTEEGSDEEWEQKVKWVGQYSSTQSILLVGDGDFSFSLALAAGFGSGANIVATSLDCYGVFVFLSSIFSFYLWTRRGFRYSLSQDVHQPALIFL
jgi:hypothetical protein